MTTKIETVMLIDDEEIDQRQYARVLKRSDLVENILTFSYADEALDFLRTHQDTEIDVIFLDINMPRMNGFEFLERVSSEPDERRPPIVFILLTTSLDPKDRERASQFEFVRDYINKPLEIGHVERAVKLLAEARG